MDRWEVEYASLCVVRIERISVEMNGRSDTCRGQGDSSFMGKGSRDEDPVEKARRKFARAQLRLHVAEDEQGQVRARGKQEVEAARLRAAEWQAKAAERVEKRTAALLRAEAKLQKLLRSEGGDEDAPATPEKTVEVLADIEELSGDVSSNGLPIVGDALPESVEVTAPEEQ